MFLLVAFRPGFIGSLDLIQLLRLQLLHKTIYIILNGFHVLMDFLAKSSLLLVTFLLERLFQGCFVCRKPGGLVRPQLIEAVTDIVEILEPFPPEFASLERIRLID